MMTEKASSYPFLSLSFILFILSFPSFFPSDIVEIFYPRKNFVNVSIGIMEITEYVLLHAMISF